MGRFGVVPGVTVRTDRREGRIDVRDRDRGRGSVECFRFVGDVRGVVAAWDLGKVSRRGSVLTRFRFWISREWWSWRCVEGERWRGAERKMYSMGMGFGEA
jgi:hypothetical protein